MVNIYGTLGPAWRKREGAGGDVFTGNDRNAAEPVPCYARRVRGSDWKDEARSRKMRGKTAASRGPSGTRNCELEPSLSLFR